jgi:hypothetical protein
MKNAAAARAKPATVALKMPLFNFPSPLATPSRLSIIRISERLEAALSGNPDTATPSEIFVFQINNLRFQFCNQDWHGSC